MIKILTIYDRKFRKDRLSNKIKEYEYQLLFLVYLGPMVLFL